MSFYSIFRHKFFNRKTREKRSGSLTLELSEGHLGGYIIGRAAPGTWCPKIWDWAVDELGVASVLDVGCGLGYAMEYFSDNGCYVLGVDGSPSAIADNRLPDRVVNHDFNSGPFIPDEPFDLVWSAEFVEHVEEKYCENFLRTFSFALKYLMITYAVPGQGGHHHVNEQPESYWLKKIQAHGFVHSPQLTDNARKLVPPAGKEGMQFRNKGLVFIKQSDPG